MSWLFWYRLHLVRVVLATSALSHLYAWPQLHFTQNGMRDTVLGSKTSSKWAKMASNSHPDVVFVFCLAVFRKTRPSKRDQKQPRHVLHWSHKDLKPTNNGVSAKSFGSYTVTTVSEPCNRFKWARLLKSQSSMSPFCIHVKSSAGKSWKRRRYNALFMSRQKKIKDKDKKPTGTGIILSELYSPRKGKHKDCWISTSPGLEKMKLTSSTGRSILKTILKQVWTYFTDQKKNWRCSVLAAVWLEHFP